MATTQSSELLEKIRKQVEYYFSDSNLPRDFYLKKLIDANSTGYVNISDLLRFKRLQQLTTSAEMVALALQGSELLELDAETSTKVKRKTELPAVSLWAKRTMYVEGFNKVKNLEKDEEPTIEEIEAVFLPYGKVLSVKRRRTALDEDADQHTAEDEKGEDKLADHKKGKGSNKGKPQYFNGSAFVEMESEEALTRVLAEPDVHSIKDKDGNVLPLKVMAAKEFMGESKTGKRKRKNKDKEGADGENDDAKKEAQADVDADAAPALGTGDGEKPSAAKKSKPSEEHGHSIPETKEKAKKKDGEDKADEESDADDNDDVQGKEPTESSKEKDKDKDAFEKGCLLRFAGVGPDVRRADIKNIVEEFGSVAYIQFKDDETDGIIRFGTAIAENVKKVLEEKNLEFGGKVPTYAIVTGDEEVEFWKQKSSRGDGRNTNHGGKFKGKGFKGGKFNKKGGKFGGRKGGNRK
mmetsp:Transcript_21700/g.37357  ORF Transcript_21700/g.37357 Transcript_21700/m.37357 type:complete len:465 (+) Transcript_21700:181-1575(+)|eukprot:CAMPEP_0184705284 /NCGR_PEP_ID=MMETSP0313-20130426/33861_1 /TAXON_ID=2792 /ORGANISM="Porphyridium aerugineum, Strain SAG 1380-2" /LENGTH=464 /DNA_ID=CAMNT_0027166585 /DNA_START=95 /DNA_END=1489 /DNA_ORIENTATION=-